MSLQSPEFKYITEDVLREWKNSNGDFKSHDSVPMPRFLYELCWAMIRGDLPFQKCRAALDSVSFSDDHSKEETTSVLADIVAHMGQDHTLPGEHRTRLVKMAKWLVESALVPRRLFQERCEEEFLWETELIKIKAQDLKAKEVRVNTRLLYQQTKFNLLREESEGYAKLVTLLCRSGLGSMTEHAAIATISLIKSFIGHFDLDPNRVFDVVLEFFELHPGSNIFYELIPIFPKSHASQILGFKFQYYHRMEVNSHVPFGLYHLTALLVKAELIELNSIYAHLLPKDSEAFDHYDAFLAKRLDAVNKIGKINLAATGKDLMDEEKHDLTADLFAAVDLESEAVSERAAELDNNQSLGLLVGFLFVEDWYHARILFDRLSHLNPVEHVQICEALFRMIEKTISSAYNIVYQRHSPGCGTSLSSCSDIMELPSISSVPSSFIDVPKELFEMLTTAGPYLYRDTLLLGKVCRLLKAYYLSAKQLVDTPTSTRFSESSNVGSLDPHLRFREVTSRIEEALGSCLLPSLQLIPANPAVGQGIWEVLGLLKYEARYHLYGEWEKEDDQTPMVLAARQTSKLDTRRILKRLAKENLKQHGRTVAKLAHANPMTVIRTIVHQIEAYKDMITPVVDAFKYLTQLEYDVLEYVVIERLALGGREKLKEDGLNLSDWLQSLASFWGHLCKKYPAMELRGLFQYLVNQLNKGIGTELVVLQELIQQMANVQYTENMTEEQLDAMAGGETLRYQATLFGMSRSNKALLKSTNRLRDSLLPKDEPKLAIPLLLFIAKHRSMVVINADVPHIKMVSEQFDRCHGTLLQYVEFLSSAVTPATAYAQLIPTLDELVHRYHLEPEVAFLIYRPIMRLFRCGSEAEIYWPLNIVEEVKTQSADKVFELSTTSADIILDLGPPRKPILWSDLLSTVHSLLPPKAWNSLSPDLYATFWGLSLYDLYVPRSRYESEIARQHNNLKALEELSDNSSSAITKRKKDKERTQELLDKLTAELQKHEEHVASVRERLSHEKDKWLSSCPDTLKINMEFLQRCIFPRCVFSMPDAVYCATFVHTLHSLGTPFFNTVNHIDVLICKTLQPMICCCTEYEVGRLGRFLYETLKMAYHWKSDESVYDRECGNMPGFAVYYRLPNSQRVTFSQFIRVHWKWSARITRLLIQCLESTEYMEIRNALITLTKISSVFPVTRKSGINLEKRVAKIKGDEREDLKVLATSVAAALASRKSSWVSEEEFGMGHIDLKPTASAAKAFVGNVQNGSALNIPQNESAGTKNGMSGSQLREPLNTVKDQIVRAKSVDGRQDRAENATVSKPDLAQPKSRGASVMNSLDIMPSVTVPSGLSKISGVQKNNVEATRVPLEEHIVKTPSKAAVESETRPQIKRSIQSAQTKQSKQDMVKDDSKSEKSLSRNKTQLSPGPGDRDLLAHPSEGRQGVGPLATANGSSVSASIKVSTSSAKVATDMPAGTSSEPRISGGKGTDDIEIVEMTRPLSSRLTSSPLMDDSGITKSSDKQQKKISPAEEQDRVTKRRKVDTEAKDGEGVEIRLSDKERSLDARPIDRSLSDHERISIEEQSLNRPTEKLLDKSKEKTGERYDKDQRDKVDRPDKSRGEESLDKARDRSLERYSRERSIERMQERGADKSFDRSIDKSRDERSKDDRNKLRHEALPKKSHLDDRFHGQTLPPPPPLPPSFVPQSFGGSRRDEEADRRISGTRHTQRLSPRHDEKERRRSEENLLVSQDDVERRREDDFRERKRDERDSQSVKVEDRERDKGNVSKDDMETSAAVKRRKVKRDHMLSAEAGEYSTVVQPSPPHLSLGTSQPFDGRDRGDRKGLMLQHRPAYVEEPLPRMHGKEATNKMTRRDSDQIYEREWEEEKRQRTEGKRKHRK